MVSDNCLLIFFNIFFFSHRFITWYFTFPWDSRRHSCAFFQKLSWQTKRRSVKFVYTYKWNKINKMYCLRAWFISIHDSCQTMQNQAKLCFWPQNYSYNHTTLWCFLQIFVETGTGKHHKFKFSILRNLFLVQYTSDNRSFTSLLHLVVMCISNVSSVNPFFRFHTGNHLQFHE